MNDLTILYCTANSMPDDTAEKIRQNLTKVTEGKYPIISVSQKPINFGHNICVGKIDQSNYNFFKQMLTGAKEVKTKHIAHVDDDTLYVAEHFTHLPPNEETFIFNSNTWIGGSKLYWHPKEELSGMFCHISPTKALINNLSVRFKKYPTPPQDQRRFGEPGKFDTEFDIPNAKVEKFTTKIPLVTFEYRGSLNGKRKRFGLTDPNSYKYDLEFFGNAEKIYNKYWSK
ncbi:MAG TPA: hypothetical protein VFI61_02320 [Patescibacteria group bacterium]|nr:hypothetical protein [Patescibacteria group bacterium]